MEILCKHSSNAHLKNATPTPYHSGNKHYSLKAEKCSNLRKTIPPNVNSPETDSSKCEKRVKKSAVVDNIIYLTEPCNKVNQRNRIYQDSVLLVRASRQNKPLSPSYFCEGNNKYDRKSNSNNYKRDASKNRLRRRSKDVSKDKSKDRSQQRSPCKDKSEAMCISCDKYVQRKLSDDNKSIEFYKCLHGSHEAPSHSFTKESRCRSYKDNHLAPPARGIGGSVEADIKQSRDLQCSKRQLRPRACHSASKIICDDSLQHEVRKCNRAATKTKDPCGNTNREYFLSRNCLCLQGSETSHYNYVKANRIKTFAVDAWPTKEKKKNDCCEQERYYNKLNKEYRSKIDSCNDVYQSKKKHKKKNDCCEQERYYNELNKEHRSKVDVCDDKYRTKEAVLNDCSPCFPKCESRHSYLNMSNNTNKVCYVADLDTRCDANYKIKSDKFSKRSARYGCTDYEAGNKYLLSKNCLYSRKKRRSDPCISMKTNCPEVANTPYYKLPQEPLQCDKRNIQTYGREVKDFNGTYLRFPNGDNSLPDDMYYNNQASTRKNHHVDLLTKRCLCVKGSNSRHPNDYYKKAQPFSAVHASETQNSNKRFKISEVGEHEPRRENMAWKDSHGTYYDSCYRQEENCELQDRPRCQYSELRENDKIHRSLDCNRRNAECENIYGCQRTQIAHPYHYHTNVPSKRCNYDASGRTKNIKQ